MFRIDKLILYGYDDEKYEYNFSRGVNYYKGKNSSGKTEFYKFIDFMFGSSENIEKKPWYKDSLKKATMYITVNNIKYILTRYKNPEENYLYYGDEEKSECISLKEYKEKLNSIFSPNIKLLRELRDFTEENLTYRTFTMFNFLGEKRQGVIQDFLDKCSDIKYSIKLSSILNFIFNDNLEKIHNLQKELKNILDEVKNLEAKKNKLDFVLNQVNNNIKKLDIDIWYTGENAEDIKNKIEQIKALKDQDVVRENKRKKNIAELEVMYSNICEQIKVYENSISDFKQFDKENSNRKLLLNKLNELIEENENFSYLVNPLKSLVLDLDNTISFNKYTINDNTILELKKQRKLLKEEIIRSDAKFKCYTLDEKKKAILLIEEYLSTDISCDFKELKNMKKRIIEIRNEIKVLQNSDDDKKILALSKYITELYKSVKGISSLVNDDILHNGFKIKYIKKGNILQPTIEGFEDEKNGKIIKDENYYIGSMARHTLIQLCGYIGFLRLLIEENKYPLIPILVIDHISKPFDERNRKAIGKVIETAIDNIGKDNIQIFMFDDKNCDELYLQADNYENLVSSKKSGFNPFYHKLTENDKDI
ncbi:hypothetical protein ACRTAK_001316 [Clostridium perfringens]